MKKIICLFFICTLNLFAQEDKVQTSKEYQESLNRSFADSLHSPLTEEDRLHFEGLDFFPIDEKFIVKAKFIKLKRQKPFEMPTTTARKPKYIKYGELHFRIDSKELVLTVYKNIDLSKRKGFKDYLFLPFLDETNGIETYGGGRYLDMRIPTSDEVIIDFNKAYNPYCAYNPEYSCPIVPLENELAVKINAGVKKFHD
ncbi:DUF1684 domain-containing protein [uncultured Flavobacterium sp.]|uniref:DUF1684 domain-containing protein n=1 Tax=uncultured Flavobacterium sp. TaxID=165435 RepID=UPI0030C88562